jgi:hypothetical protein
VLSTWRQGLRRACLDLSIEVPRPREERTTSKALVSRSETEG